MASDISAAIKLVPVSWLHRPALLMTYKSDAPAMKIGPLAAAVIGVAAGAGIQLSGQALRKTTPEEQRSLIESVECQLSVSEIEKIALQCAEDARKSKSSILEQIAASESAGAKPFPIATAAFLAGVAAGAAAARP
ncbi:MAG: hypothetical protein HXY30_17935 [Pseudorhodoplanes sp.]|nr:hypothetical protein [Pseudorhodoplanes sp.]